MQWAVGVVSMQSLARAVIRASQRFGQLGELSPSEQTALLEADLITQETSDRHVLTPLGWDLARRLERAAGTPHADAMAIDQR